jgi:hypothetical protein
MTAFNLRTLGAIAAAAFAFASLQTAAAQAQSKEAVLPGTLRAVVVLDSSDLASDFMTLAVTNTGLGKLAGARAIVLPQRDPAKTTSSSRRRTSPRRR